MTRAFYVECCRNYGRFMVVLRCWTHFLLITHVFDWNHLISLRWPYIDLRRRVHLKHQNLILWCWKFWQKKCDLYGEEHDVQSHMLRPTITDIQNKYCGTCYDIYLIQSQYTKVTVSFVLALNKVNIIAVTTILVLHVGNGWSEHVWLDIMFLAVRWVIGSSSC